MWGMGDRPEHGFPALRLTAGLSIAHRRVDRAQTTGRVGLVTGKIHEQERDAVAKLTCRVEVA